MQLPASVIIGLPAQVPETWKIRKCLNRISRGAVLAFCFDRKFTVTGQAFVGIVPENNFYGVHVEAGQWIEVECDE